MRPVFPRTTVTLLAFFAAFLLVYLIGFYNLDAATALAQFAKAGEVRDPLRVLATQCLLYRRGVVYYWLTLGWFTAGWCSTARTGSRSCSLHARE